MTTMRTTSKPGATRFALSLAWSITWRILAFLIGWGAIAAPFMVLGSKRLAVWSQSHATMARLSGDGVVVFAILAASWLLMHFVEKRPLREIGLEGPGRLAKFATGLVIGVAWLAVPLAIAWLGGFTSPVDHGAFPWTVMPVAALALIVNVVAQQLLLCGYIFAIIRMRAGLIPAISISGLLFVLYHAAGYNGELIPMFNVFLTALLFCLLREISGGIWLPLGAHAAWNFLLGPVLGLTVSGRDQITEGWSAFRFEGPAWITGGPFGIEGSVVVTLVTASIGGVILFRLRRRRSGFARF